MIPEPYTPDWPANSPSLRIVHLSDLHFGTASKHLAQRLLRQIHELKPQLTIISGDLTQRARSEEFLEAEAFIHQLPSARLIVPGNHDLAAWRLHERILYPWQKWKRYISPKLENVVRGEGFTAVGINTARRWGLEFDWSRGRINLRQLNWIESEISQSPPEHLHLVVTHHPFFLTEAALHRGLVGRFAIAWPRLKAAGVDLILSGHIHLAYARLYQGMVIAQAGSGISRRLKGEANSFNFIQAHKNQIEISHLYWQGEHFTSGLRQLFVRGPHGFEEALLPEFTGASSRQQPA